MLLQQASAKVVAAFPVTPRDESNFLKPLHLIIERAVAKGVENKLHLLTDKFSDCKCMADLKVALRKGFDELEVHLQ